MNNPVGFRVWVLLSVLMCVESLASDLEPAGPPGSPETQMKSLNEIEPRVAIGSIPYVITNSGAYYLVGNLAGSPGSNGVTIMCSDVRLDLNRFALVGVTGSLCGIVIADGVNNITIEEGVVRNWGDSGIHAPKATDSSLLSVTARTNGYAKGGSGARFGSTWFIENCVFLDNASNGVTVVDHCTIRETKALRNARNGIYAEDDCRIVGCTASFNQRGILAIDHCMIHDCLAANNTVNGIEVGQLCRITDNNCANNAGNAGISLNWNGNRVEGNTLANNKYGVYTYSWCSGNLIIRNNASGNTSSNFYLDGNERAGEMLMFNALPEIFTNSNPWANFSF